MPPASHAPAAAPRLWPMTALIVTLAVLLMLVDGFNAMIQVAAFFGQTAVCDDYIASGMTFLTALPAFTAMVWFGWQHGSRNGLILIGAPATLMAYVGLHLLGTDPGGPRDPAPNRAGQGS